MDNKPTLHLAGQKKGGPTPEHIFALVRKLTGREPSQEEREEICTLYKAKTE